MTTDTIRSLTGPVSVLPFLESVQSSYRELFHYEGSKLYRTSVLIHQTTRRHISKYLNLYANDVKPHIEQYILVSCSLALKQVVLGKTVLSATVLGATVLGAIKSSTFH
jgi:hypothetical protein